MDGLKLKLVGSDGFRKMDFIAWRDDRRAFFAKPRNGKPRVMDLVPSCSSLGVWIEPPFPESAPIKIEPCLLLSPPCYENVAVQENCIDPEPWERAWMGAHGHSFLFLTEEDDKPLAGLLGEYKDAVRSEGECGKPDMTLDMVKAGCAGIRDSYLARWWGTQNGIDLEAMTGTRQEFMRYLQSHVGNKAVISDFRGGLRRGNHEGFRFIKFNGEEDPRFKLLCALVKYRVGFENGETAFLFDCTERAELRAAERKELERWHGVGVPQARRTKEAREKAGRIPKVDDPLTRKAIVAEYRRRLKNQKPKTAAEGVAHWASERFGIKLTYRTVQNYEKAASEVEK